MAKNVNAKIQRITEGTLVIGIDIAKHTHVARSVDWGEYLVCMMRLLIFTTQYRIVVGMARVFNLNRAVSDSKMTE